MIERQTDPAISSEAELQSAILSTSRMLYAVSLVFAAVGVLLRGNGYLLLIPLPF